VTAASENGHGPPELLLVEDNLGDVRLVERMLAKRWKGNFALSHFERLSDAVRHVARSRVDCVLLDLSLPDADGLEAIAQTRRVASEVPIVVLSGLEEEDLAVEAVRGGADDYLVKGSIDGDHLSRSIRYAIERKQIEIRLTRLRERIRQAFGTYVDPEVVDHILSEGPSLVPQEVEVTMMFVDICAFTSLAERSEPREVVSTLNCLFALAVPIIARHGGHVDKFVGDGLLAVFGAPRPLRDHANRAVQAALEIDQTAREQFKGDLEIGIGIDSGTVVAGNVGGGGRFDFTVIGNAVNVAAGVEAATRRTDDTILITEHAKRALRSVEVAWEERPSVPLKGKPEGVILYAPCALRQRVRAPTE
jgi:class 3 adenylate cyclase